jgi:hypothetical protein
MRVYAYERVWASTWTENTFYREHILSVHFRSLLPLSRSLFPLSRSLLPLSRSLLVSVC